MQVNAITSEAPKSILGRESEKREEMITTELMTAITEDAVNRVVALQEYFPLKLKYTRDEVIYYLSNPQNLVFFLLVDGKVCGYLLALPQNTAVEEMIMDDPLLKKDDNRYCIDQVVVMPGENGSLKFLHLGFALLKEMEKRGTNRVSSYLAHNNGVDKIIHSIFGPMATEVRKVYMPKYGEDPFLYMEVTYNGMDFRVK